MNQWEKIIQYINDFGSISPMEAFSTDKNWTELDHWLKRMCQEYYIEVAKIGSRDDWYREFGRFYDDRDLGITKLATRISEMRKDGIEFEQKWECSKNRYGQPVRYMRYSMRKKI